MKCGKAISVRFPRCLTSKEFACQAEDTGSIPGLGRSPGEGNINQYSFLENPMDRGAWWATVHGVARVGHGLVTKAPPRATRESQELSGEEDKRWPCSHSLKCPRQQLQIADKHLTQTVSLRRSPWAWPILRTCTAKLSSVIIQPCGWCCRLLSRAMFRWFVGGNGLFN